MKNKRSKALIGVVFLLLMFPLVTSVVADDDTSEGDMALDLDNDAPIFIQWYEATVIIDENLPILFTAIIQDIDNTTAELNVTLYYSSDLFVTDNNSISMIFDAGLVSYQYQFPGQPGITTYKYYYTVFDGTTLVRKPTTAEYYFDIQWGLAIRFDGPSRRPTIFERVLPDLPLLLLVLLSLLFLFSSFFMVVHQRRTEELVVPKGASVTRIAYTYGNFYIRQSAKLISREMTSITRRGILTGGRAGKEVTLGIHAGVTAARTKPEIVGTQDKITLQQAGRSLSFRTKLKNVFIGVFSDTKYLAQKLQYQGEIAFAKATGRALPKRSKPVPHIYKNPMSSQYRKLRGHVKTAEHKVHSAQKQISQTTSNSVAAKTQKTAEHKVQAAQKKMSQTNPNRVVSKTQKKMGLFSRINNRMKKTERRIGRYAQGRGRTNYSSKKFRRPPN